MSTIYWISTTILSAFLLWSAYSYFFSEATIQGVRELGFPDFFRLQLGMLKFIAVPVLLIPAVPLWVKEWGYAGTALFLITAMVAHVAHRDSPALLVVLFMLFASLVASRYALV